MSMSIKSLYDWYRNTLRNPKYRWWMILGTLLYLISPFDLAPDFLPIVGQIDDIMLLTLLISEVSQLVIDYAKSRQSNFSAPTANETRKTVEVDAVSVE